MEIWNTAFLLRKIRNVIKNGWSLQDYKTSPSISAKKRHEATEKWTIKIYIESLDATWLAMGSPESCGLVSLFNFCAESRISFLVPKLLFAFNFVNIYDGFFHNFFTLKRPYSWLNGIRVNVSHGLTVMGVSFCLSVPLPKVTKHSWGVLNSR